MKVHDSPPDIANGEEKCRSAISSNWILAQKVFLRDEPMDEGKASSESPFSDSGDEAL